jgi:uncharacterized protein YjiS (DUF1127 family)
MLNKLKSFLQKLNNQRIINAEIRATMNELRKLSDKELNDIGLSRGDIYSVAHGHVDNARYVAPVNPNLKGAV